MERPKVGVGVFVLKEGKVLFGKRKNSHGEGSWGLPGGHLELNEELEDCARREVLEETGMKIKNVRIGTFTNDIFKEEGKHYITLFIVAEHESGEPQIKEPDRCEKWEWHDWKNPPAPLFIPLQNLRKQDFDPLR